MPLDQIARDKKWERNGSERNGQSVQCALFIIGIKCSDDASGGAAVQLIAARVLL